ncbi:MAG: hypothetical protein ACE5LF_02490 [Alphaproteobacteria bacterium]
MSRTAPVLAALAAGLALLVLAGPRAAAGLAALPARPVIAELRSGAAVAPRFVAVALDSESAALEWIDDGRAWADLGLLHWARGQSGGFSGDHGRAALERAIAIDRRGLALSPAQAYVWTRLAHAELLRRGPAPRLGPLLELAIVAAPFDRRLTFPRLELCFTVWRQLDPAVHDIVARQVRFAARLRPERLAALAKRRYATGIVREALAETAELRGAFDAAFLKL